MGKSGVQCAVFKIAFANLSRCADSFKFKM